MTSSEQQALSERIAALAEAAGLPSELVWAPAETCPQGHENYHEVYIHGGASTHWEENAPWQPGDLCQPCMIDATPRLRHMALNGDLADACQLAEILAKEHRDDPGYHPEWRIGRQAKDLLNPAHLLPLVEAWRLQELPESEKKLTARYWAMDSAKAGIGDGMACAVVSNEFRHVWAWNEETPWEALAQAFLAALEATKGNGHD